MLLIFNSTFDSLFVSFWIVICGLKNVAIITFAIRDPIVRYIKFEELKYVTNGFIL